jgi:hypothetical protein
METTIYRIVQEALTNVLKHAGASKVSLIVERRRREVLAIIEDNGNGNANVYDDRTSRITSGCPTILKSCKILIQTVSGPSSACSQPWIRA